MLKYAISHQSKVGFFLKKRPTADVWTPSTDDWEWTPHIEEAIFYDTFVEAKVQVDIIISIADAYLQPFPKLTIIEVKVSFEVGRTAFYASQSEEAQIKEFMRVG